MSQVIPVFRREFLGYFRSPVAYVLLAAFSLIATALWFFFPPKFLRTDTASLEGFFFFFPWIFLFFVPAVAMRLWAEERRSGTVELLLTLPMTTADAVIGKFLAAWAFIGLGIVITVPCAVTVAYLGDPDWGAIFTGYFGAILMSAAYLGICSLTSALTRNQVISFILSLIVCLALTMLGYSLFSEFAGGFLPVWLVDALSSFSFITHFESMKRGLVDLGALIFFGSLTIVALAANIIVLER